MCFTYKTLHQRTNVVIFLKYSLFFKKIEAGPRLYGPASILC